MLNSADAKRTYTGDGLHWFELEPGLQETDLGEERHQPFADLFDIALLPGPVGSVDEGDHFPRAMRTRCISLTPVS